MSHTRSCRRTPFLTGVFLIAFSTLLFQIVQTRILSVMAWYYMAFFTISIAMLGMTVGAVWVYLRPDRFESPPLPMTLSTFSLLTAIAMPVSSMVQYSLITSLSLSFTTVVAWSILSIAMAVPYVFGGVVVSLALTRSPFPAGLVYGFDLIGAALGCIAVIGVLNFVDGPTAIFVAGLISAVSGMAFALSYFGMGQNGSGSKPVWRRSLVVVAILFALVLFNSYSAFRFRPILVKDRLEPQTSGRFEKWNSYSRIIAASPYEGFPLMWGPSPAMPADTTALQSPLNIDGAAATAAFHYDGTPQSVNFLKYDIVGLAYRLPGIHSSAVVGVGGGRDILTAHVFGSAKITGVELNPIFIDLHTSNPDFSRFSNLRAIPNLKFHVDDARSWFASTSERFDLVQMSMIDTWAATGAGAFSLSENGLYTLEGWRAFLNTLTPNGFFTVSRWYSPGDVNESGRMIGLGMAALIDSGTRDPHSHIFVAATDHIATLVISKSPFTPGELAALEEAAQKLKFSVLVSPDQGARSELLGRVVECTDLATLNRVLGSTYLDLTVSTDRRPFFFNQLRAFDIRSLVTILKMKTEGKQVGGVMGGNLAASGVLVMILFIAIIAVIASILTPLKRAVRNCPRQLILTGSLYFSLIGMGFMLAEIALLQYFSVYLGHPIYSLGVCLFSLILACGIGSLTSEHWRVDSMAGLLLWGGAIVVYLLLLNLLLPSVFSATTGKERLVRILVSLAAVMPLGFLLGFAFPTGMRLVSAIDQGPTPWFWGINGASGVLASVLGLMTNIYLGINISLYISAVCYLALVPAGFGLLGLRQHAPAQVKMANA